MMPSPFPAWRLIDSLTIFISIWVILSVWAGYAGFLSPFVGVASAVLTYFFIRRADRKSLPSDNHAGPSIPYWTLIVIAGGMGLVMFGLQGGYDLSADVAPSLAAQVIEARIPSTFLPYFDIPFLYQAGLPALASQLSWTGIPLFIWLWTFALLGAGLFLIGLLRFGQSIHTAPSFLFWIPILFLGTRLPFYNIFVGEYPWVLAMGLGMMAMGLFSRSWILGFVALGAATLVHPYIGALFALVWIAFYSPDFKKIGFTLIGVAVLNIPYVLFQILPYLTMPKLPPLGAGAMTLESVSGTLSLIGIIPSLAAGAWVVQKMRAPLPLERNDILLFLLGFGTLAASIFIEARWHETILGPKILTLSMIGIVLMGAKFLSTAIKTPRTASFFALVILLVCGAILAASAGMQHYALGSKATIQEAQFSTFLKSMDGKAVPVLFLSSGVGKMAQYADKISPDPDAAHPLLAYQLLDTPEANALHQQSQEYQKIKKTCYESCIDSYLEKYPSAYIAVNTLDYSPLEKKTEILRRGKFILYAGNTPNK